MALLAAGLVTAGIGAYKAIKGASDTAAAKKRALYNIRPNFDISPEYFTNRNIAGSLAGQGLTSDATSYYGDQASRGLGSSIGALLQTGGGINNIQDLYDKFDNNNRAIATQDSEQKVANIKNLMLANNQLADQRTQKWVLDKLQPFQDEAKSISAQKAQGAGEVNSGLNTIGGAVSSYAGATTRQEDPIVASQDKADGSQIPMPNNPAMATPYQPPQTLPAYTIPGTYDARPSSAMNVELPDSYDGLVKFDNSARSIAASHIINKYKNSPYAQNLPYYLQSA